MHLKKLLLACISLSLISVTGIAQVIVNSGGTLNVDPGGTLVVDTNLTNSGTINNQGTIQITGNWTNSSTYQGNGLVSFNGTSGNQTFDHQGSGDNIDDLTINKSSGNVVLASSIQVDSAVTLTSGHLVLGSSNLTMGSGGSFSGGSSSSYIQTSGTGRLVRPAGSSVSYPVGFNPYMPVTVDCGGCTGNIQVSVADNVYDNPVTQSTAQTQNAVGATWTVSSANGGSPNITLGWDASEELTSFDSPSGENVYLATWQSGSSSTWDQGTAAVINGGTATTRSGVSLGAGTTHYLAVADEGSDLISLAISVDVTTFLGGAYSGSSMTTTLNSGSHLPFSQPYNTSPWNYGGSESVGSIPNANVVDWILIEIRDTTSAANANSGTAVDTAAAFILNNGSIVGIDGSSAVTFEGLTITNSMYVVLHHRNHISIMSANALSESGGTYSYNFSTASSQAYTTGGNAQVDLGSGVFGMYAGETNNSSAVTAADKVLVNTDNAANATGYLTSDTNLSGATTAADKIPVNSGNQANAQSYVP